MGRIKKAATERHTATLSPFVRDFVKQAAEVPLHRLPAHLDDFPQHWPLPRGDLYHWIPLLDRFDHVLEIFNKEYGLDEGPQMQPFTRNLLMRGDAEEGLPYPSFGASSHELDAAGFSDVGDEQLVASIVHFTRILLEHCGNRSLYASSTHINNLLHTTSLSLLRLCLKLSLRLAQRYQVARFKNHHPSAQAALLSNHYNFKLDNVQKMAMPFPRPPTTVATTQTPSKSKDKATTLGFNPSDLVALAKEPLPASVKAEMSAVNITYYEPSKPDSRPTAVLPPSDTTPPTPTPARRASNLGPSRERPSTGERSVSTSDVTSPATKPRDSESVISNTPKLFHISAERVAEAPAWSLIKEASHQIPLDMQYDLLNRVRIAKSFSSPDITTQQLLLETRLLAIANLAYAYGEAKFQEKIGTPDAEEPRRFHLAQQLCDLLQPSTNDQKPVGLQTETTVLLVLEALAKCRHKIGEVAETLAITANHGVLYYELRKLVGSLELKEHEDIKMELREAGWREAIFDLINSLLQSNTQARYGEKMVNAGIMAILVEVLGLRTTRAQRMQERVLQFLDSFIHGIPTAFQTLADLRGLNIIADLTASSVGSALGKSRDGNGLPDQYKSKVVDYDIPYYLQSILRQLFKNTGHMFEHSAGTYDRLLRNLIDTPHVLAALRTVIDNAKVFGSNVWSGAVNILSSFIHHEPTSYQVIGEAGLSKSLLESVTGQAILEDTTSKEHMTSDLDPENVPSALPYASVDGILPVGEVMCDIPTAFGAICLNESGMQLFQASGALRKFLDIFLSPAHVRAMEEEGQTANTIGHSFDELSRHHPRLKDEIMAAIINMVTRLRDLCNHFAKYQLYGAKLWELENGGFRISGGLAALGLQAVADGEAISSGTRNVSPNVSNEPVADPRLESDAESAPALLYLSACFKFLEGFFHNSSMCALFAEESGAELLLDLATSSSNPYDLVAFPIFSKIAQVFKVLSESKPHLVLPSLVRRIQNAADGLKVLTAAEGNGSWFARFVDNNATHGSVATESVDGTTTVKLLLNVHSLTHVLGRTLAPPPYLLRHGQNNGLFVALNFTDVYIDLVETLSRLHSTCLWEGLFFQELVSEELKVKSDPRAYVMRRIDANGMVEISGEKQSPESTAQDQNISNGDNKDLSQETVLAGKNAKVIRYLLGQVPMGVEAFFHSLGQAIVTKRSDAASKQHAHFVAERLAKCSLWELDHRRSAEVPEALETKYVASLLNMVGRMLLKNSYSTEQIGTKEALVAVVNKFFLVGGFKKLNRTLDHFVKILAKQEQTDKTAANPARDAIHSILSLYAHIVRSRCINDASQTNAMLNRERSSPDFFQPGQLLVEIRDAVLPAITRLWQSEEIEKFSESNLKTVIDILRSVLKGEGEERAIRRSDNLSRRVVGSSPVFKLRNNDGFDRLRELGYDAPLCREALFRCNNIPQNSEAYCLLRKTDSHVPRFPVPQDEPESSGPEATRSTHETTIASNSSPVLGVTNLDDQVSVDMDGTDASDPAATNPVETSTENANVEVLQSSDDEMSEDGDLGSLGALPEDLRNEDLRAMVSSGDLSTLTDRSAAKDISSVPLGNLQPFVTVDDLEEKRDTFRDSLVDRCLDILGLQPSLTFELADLIHAAVSKFGEPGSPRAEIATTLISSLVSLQAEEPSKESATKIQAHAHLVALILQERDFFDIAVDELKDYFDTFVGWVKRAAEQKLEDTPWVETVLLIVERVLAEDEQPTEIKWIPPPAEEPTKPMPQASPPDRLVSLDFRTQLLNALVEILPKIGKNPSLALSVLRVLVTLTRDRTLALRLSEKPTLGRLFLMIRQLAGAINDKLQSSFMLILRHIVEDEDTLRRIMRAEIKAAFESHRSRPMDTTTYTRNHHHLVLRSPSIFMEITKELLDMPRYDGHPQRGQVLGMKKPVPPAHADVATESDPSAESADGTTTTDTQKPSETKPPALETSDGVVQFLLRELSNYKDVEDTPPQPVKGNETDNAAESAESGPENDRMPDAGGSNGPNAEPAGVNKTTKPVFNAEEHVIYSYRCFILQCLAELLASYNNTKVEFINFSRKAETQSSTPSKPRSGTLNYLLNVLLPVGTLEHRDDVSHRKKLVTSSKAVSVLVSLCGKTTEKHISSADLTDTNAFAEAEPELLFVRKFVLEHALRSFKDAIVSSEPLDSRYSRLLALGELFNRMLNGKSDFQRAHPLSGVTIAAQQQVGRLMYEKNFIGALTSAIAELDLNFPNAKRAVKYLLGPLKQLTELGITLSQSVEFSSSTGPGTSTDEDEISSATSLSGDEDADREQTPDLFRGSSLGMFESGGDEDDDSGSDSEEGEDDDMYGDGFEEEMDYEEEAPPEHGEVVSDDDDDELTGMNEMGEIEGVPGDVEMEIDIRMQEEDDDTDDDDITDEDEDDDEDDDEGGDPDVDDFSHHGEDIMGDDGENESMGDHDDEGDWEDDGVDLDGAVIRLDGGSPHGGPLEHIAHILGAEDPSDPDDVDGMLDAEGLVRLDMGAGEEDFFEDEMPPGEDDEDGDDEGGFDDNVAYEPEADDEDDDEMDNVWERYAPPAPVGAAVIRGGHHHHHHHRHALNDMLGMIGEPMRATFRSHRGGPNARDEDGVNPLLQRNGGAAGNNRDREIADAFNARARRSFFPRDGNELFQGLLQGVTPAGTGPGVINLNIDPATLPGSMTNLPPIFTLQGRHGHQHVVDLESNNPTWREQFGPLRGWPDMLPNRSGDLRGNTNSDEAHAVDFQPTRTSNRWQEEARMLFPGKPHEKASRIINTLLAALVPIAMEAKRVREQLERERKVADEAAQEETRRKAEADKAEVAARETKEREEREAKEREEEAAHAREEAESGATDELASSHEEDSEMEGVEEEQQGTASEAAATQTQPNEPRERVTINIRGRDIDITGLGIDRAYLEELPEDFREEVIMTQFAEQRQQAAQSGEEPSEISREFLEALPREIQQELLRQEAEERRRRERTEARRQATQQGNAAATAAAAQQPEEMNNMDFMATLDPHLRQTILMDAAGANDEAFASLPEEMQAEARALYGDRRLPAIRPDGGRLGRGLDPIGARILNGQNTADDRGDQTTREISRQRRPVAQMLDKSGIATLLRLMFVSLNHKAKGNLHGILSDVCKNTQNRAEVISILLSILQDGTADVNAVERSFAQLSLRAKQSSSSKAPQTPKRSLNDHPHVPSSTELSPLNIVQQCLATLNALANGNPRVPSFFLNEHETIVSQKAKATKKGKGRESKAAKFPLNALLTLLDRKLITENTAVMETLASLLSHVTHPLTILLRRAKEAEEAENAETGPVESEGVERPRTSASDVVMGDSAAAEVADSANNEAVQVPSAAAEEAKAANTDSKKKRRDLTPPEVPEENIRLVVNILAARECLSKTFSDTLDIIKNLSAIPGAKEIFGRELIRQAKELGQTLLEDLVELSKQINAAGSGTELQGMALASFSSAGSKQRKLLRVLVALDHLFDPKRTPAAQSSSPSTQAVDQKLKDDILATLYESTTFDRLWDGLSECLRAIRRRGNMVNVATILLPLIESLMVVCRNSALKDAPATASTAVDNSAGTPPPTDVRMDSLFFNFTEDHRKILNELIRNNPKLMNGNLSVLAKNSKVLEFDNKRSYFSRKLHDRRSEVRVPHASLQLSVRRDQVFLDSFKSLYYKSGNEIKYGKLNIRFIGEEGIDAGGVSREWFAAMARQMFNGDYALFNPVASDRTTFHPNALSEINPEHLLFFKFIGRIIGKALYEGRVLDCHFSRAVYRRILGKSVSLKDMESLDLDYYKSLVWILENDITDVTFETFSVDVDRFGVTDTIDLIPNGRNVSVTEDNKHEYVRLVVEYRLLKSVQTQLDEFLNGFHEIIPFDLVSIFNEQELELLISGLPEVDVDDWRNNTDYHNYQPTSPQIQWFWRAVRSFDKEERAKLLQFVTGTSKVPLNGFKELEGMNGFSKFNIHRDYSSKEKLPSSHTCFNQLDLPEYESYEHLRTQLYTAITAGSEYFGFA